MIPKRLVRVVPEVTTPEVELWWEHACNLHERWEHVTLRDPIDPLDFPITANNWDTCESGAQLADLVRAEELFWRGGVYLDSDVEVYRSFEPLTALDGFAGWDSQDYIPNAVMGFRPQHQALIEVMAFANQRHNEGTWAAGVGVTTEVFRGREDMVLFPPGSFYPIFWRDAQRGFIDWSKVPTDYPWAYAAHHAHHSWREVAK